MMLKLLAAAGLMLVASTAGYAQGVVWKETISIPKGQNMPSGVKADILGLEVGSTYEEAKAVLQRLLAEAPPPPKPALTPQQEFQQRMIARSNNARSTEPFEEHEITISLPVSSGPPIKASYVGEIVLRRQLPGSTDTKINEEILVRLSAPSSGHQVVAIKRELRYFVQADQPLISDLVAALKEKFKGSPSIEAKTGRFSTYKFVFARGSLGSSTDYARIRCEADDVRSADRSENVPAMNARRQCDVVFETMAEHGISDNHASTLTFMLGDVQRAKENASADYKFFDNYVNTIQKRGGSGPKL